MLWYLFMPSRQLLVVDDDHDILDALQFVLEDAGYQVETSESADEAERLPDTGETLPKLIILDVLLSGKDGRAICKRLKSEKRTMQIPIIMISAHPDAGDSVKRAGADEFIPKPFDISFLLSRVSYYLQQQNES
jgi:DNA-binding response OmpR family regulator